MWYEGLFEEMESLKNDEQSAKMSSYMQNQFEFLGIPKPILKTVMKPYLQKGKKEKLDRAFVRLCWSGRCLIICG